MNVEVTKRERVWISKEESLRIAIKQIEQVYNLSDLSLVKGELFREDISVHSTNDVKVRDATDEDLMALEVIRNLRSELA